MNISLSQVDTDRLGSNYAQSVLRELVKPSRITFSSPHTNRWVQVLISYHALGIPRWGTIRFWVENPPKGLNFNAPALPNDTPNVLDRLGCLSHFDVNDRYKLDDFIETELFEILNRGYVSIDQAFPYLEDTTWLTNFQVMVRKLPKFSSFRYALDPYCMHPTEPRFLCMDELCHLSGLTSTAKVEHGALIWQPPDSLLLWIESSFGELSDEEWETRYDKQSDEFVGQYTDKPIRTFDFSTWVPKRNSRYDSWLRALNLRRKFL